MAPLFKLLVVEGEEKKERGAVASSQTNAFDLNRHAFLLTDHLPPKGKKKKKKFEKKRPLENYSTGTPLE